MIKKRLKDFLHTLPPSEEHPCVYYPDRKARVKAAMFEHDRTPAVVSGLLMEAGFRRTGQYYYRPNCSHCEDCISYRVRVKDFHPSRSQKRVLRRNSDMVFKVGRPALDSLREQLYLKYQRGWHNQTETDDALLQDMRLQLYTNPETTLESQLLLNGQLIGFGILDIDAAGKAASTVYFVFDPDFAHRSLGVLSILHEIEWCRAHGFDFYHLGYHIPGHPKMDYKAKFTPAETMSPTQFDWQLQNHS